MTLIRFRRARMRYVSGDPACNDDDDNIRHKSCESWHRRASGAPPTVQIAIRQNDTRIHVYPNTFVDTWDVCVLWDAYFLNILRPHRVYSVVWATDGFFERGKIHEFLVTSAEQSVAEISEKQAIACGRSR